MEFFNMSNVTFNQTWNHNFMQQDASQEIWTGRVKLLRSICVPLIVGAGLFGNTLCFMVFVTKNMRQSSCSVFLASLAFADNSFLICLLLTWIDGDVRTIMKTDFACQVLIFMTYITSFLNAWFIVGFTCERFLAICLPLRTGYMCSVFREKVTVITLCISACLMYSFSFWTTGLIQWGPSKRCSHKIDFFQFLSVVTWIDTFMTMLIPFCVILCINSLVLRTVIKGTLAQRRMQEIRQRRSDAAESSLIEDKNDNTKPVRMTGKQRSLTQIRVARTLFVVSLIFIFLNLPSHAIRLYNLIDTTTSENPSVSIEFYFFQELTVMLYYTTFSCNFVLYTLFGRNFKNSLLMLIRCKSVADDRKKKMLQKLTPSQDKRISKM